jgi:hypothetical protein
MIKFFVLVFKSLTNDAHLGFFDSAVKELSGAGQAVKDALGDLVDRLTAWHSTEHDYMEWYRKSVFTGHIAEANKQLDHTFSGMRAKINADLYDDHQPVVKAAAERIHIMLQSAGDVTKKKYSEKEAVIRLILDHLSGDMAADAQAANIKSWIIEMQTALATFSSLLEQRDVQSLGKPKMKMTDIRRSIEDVWRQIVSIVDASALLNTSPAFAAFIESLNPEIERLNQQFHHGKKDINDAQPEPIRDQPYTGYPCTPLPEVLYVTPEGTAKLELGKDFNIAYKKNVEVGIAECIIYGKGRYNGSKTVTFAIIHV